MAARNTDPKPSRVSVRVYQVGFGDAVLVSFGYDEAVDGRDERHLLFDFGSTHGLKELQQSYGAIAGDIASRTDDQLDVLVVTHRHKDHLDAFANEEAAAKIAELKPRLVVRPWTDDPEAAADAKAPGAPGKASRQFAASVHSAQEFAREVGETISAAYSLDRRTLRGELALLALDEVPNKEAIDRIDELAEAASEGARYVYAGADSGIEGLIPGVGARVIGPPTLEQWPEAARQAANDPEFWIRQRPRLERMLAFAAERPGVREVQVAAKTTGLDPGPARWLVERMRDQHTHSLMRIVRSIDAALNNTSVVLLLETGTRRLLFPGDAQIENWSYALTGEQTDELREGLDEVDLYKVGHHGSRNATPKSLVGLWENGGRPLVSVMSTKPKVHGNVETGTEVPRTALVEALEKLGALYRTDTLAKGQAFVEVTASTTDSKPFEPRDT